MGVARCRFHQGPGGGVLSAVQREVGLAVARLWVVVGNERTQPELDVPADTSYRVLARLEKLLVKKPEPEVLVRLEPPGNPDDLGEFAATYPDFHRGGDLRRSVRRHLVEVDRSRHVGVDLDANRLAAGVVVVKHHQVLTWPAGRPPREVHAQVLERVVRLGEAPVACCHAPGIAPGNEGRRNGHHPT